MTAFADLETIAATTTVIVCDWNGTIVDDTERARAATNATLAAFGQPPLDAEAFGAAFRLPLAAFFQHLGVAEARRDAAIRDWNARLAGGECALSPGVTGLLATARQLGIPVGIVSAADEAVVRADAERLGIAGDLAFIMGGATDKAATLRGIAAAAANPGTVLYIGDTEYDLDSAARAGVAGLGFGGGYRPASALRQAEIAIDVIDDFAILGTALLRAREI